MDEDDTGGVPVVPRVLSKRGVGVLPHYHRGEELARMVLMRAEFGGTQVIDMLVGDPVPRIC